jgi:hypothetical protein
LLLRVFEPFIKNGTFAVDGVVHQRPQPSDKPNWCCLVWNTFVPASRYRAVTAFRPYSTHPEPVLLGPWKWILPDIQIVKGLRLNYAVYEDWDKMTLALCEYAGKCLAHCAR